MFCIVQTDGGETSSTLLIHSPNSRQNKFSWLEHILLHKHIQMILTQVLTTYEVHTKNKNFNCVVV